MSDTYQPIYDATRSRISGCNVGDVVAEEARKAFDMSYAQSRLMDSINTVEAELCRPFVTMRPRVFIDGNQWIALYGDNIQDGVAGCGRSPHEASVAFDKAWSTPLSPTVSAKTSPD